MPIVESPLPILPRNPYPDRRVPIRQVRTTFPGA